MRRLTVFTHISLTIFRNTTFCHVVTFYCYLPVKYVIRFLQNFILVYTRPTTASNVEKSILNITPTVQCNYQVISYVRKSTNHIFSYKTIHENIPEVLAYFSCRYRNQRRHDREKTIELISFLRPRQELCIRPWTTRENTVVFIMILPGWLAVMYVQCHTDTRACFSARMRVENVFS